MSASASNSSVAATSIVGVLRARALETPRRVAYTFLRDGEVEESPLTYAALDEQARAIAAWLQDEGAAGERALLLYPPGLEFVAAFFACLYAGVVAIPAYPPRPSRPDPRIREIVADAQATLALTTEAVRSAMEARLGEAPGLDRLRWLATDTVRPSRAEHWREPALNDDGLAFLQYTSGSTVTPKGVMVSHRNVLQNTATMQKAQQYNKDAVKVTWLPHFHDLGLIYGILQPLCHGFPCYLMSPAAFLQRPLLWLQAMTRYRGTHSGGPNFAYDLCVSRIRPDQRSELDLSSWQVALNGAEPVRRTTLERFADAFAPYGFRRSALSPAYGLAEATLVISSSWRAAPTAFYHARVTELEHDRVVLAPEGDPDGKSLVGCGPPDGVERLLIVDPQTLQPCPADRVGEIWVSGPSVTKGYWNRPEETASTFRAFVTGSGEGPFLRTGDLGFLSDGELFITGRLKDLVIIRGLNHYPQDIELTVQSSHPALRPGAGAAFGVELDEEEHLVIVQEVERTQRNSELDQVARAIRRAVAEEHEIDPHAIVLIRPGSILKTSSGKIQRRGCRAAFLEGGLSVLHEWRRPVDPSPALMSRHPSAAGQTESAIAAWLIARLAGESGVDPDEIDLGQPFVAFGVDSARALLLVGDLETWLGRRLPPIVLWNYPTVEALARHLAA